MTDTSAATDDHGIDITVAVSCYNEEEFIGATLDCVVGALSAIGCSYEIIVVDDASHDNSVKIIREHLAAHPDLPIKLKANTINRGLGYNYAEAAFAGSGKYYRLTCGDNGEPKEALVNLFQHIGRADMIIPFNYKPVKGKSRIRHVLSKGYTLLVNLLSGYNIRYYNGLAIHLRYNVIRWPSSSYGFGFQADVITRLLDEGASYMQVPSFGIDRKGSFSTALSMRNIYSVIHTFLEIAIRRLRKSMYGEKMPAPVEIRLDNAVTESHGGLVDD
jgi:glycosyltransferase involved in cell wall biosynthesis